MTFHSQLVTSNRGPLARIWLAAHWERKLTKVEVLECNLETSISDIICPKMIIGLRSSGHLLIGVVKIYCRKANYLLADCNDAMVKVKMEFRPGRTDLPVERLEATHKAITLMEDFTSFDAQLPDPCLYRDTSDEDVVDHSSLNQSRPEEITLKEDFGTDYLKLIDFGGESQNHHTGLLDMSLQGLTHHGDAFGDEDEGFDLSDFLTIPSDHVDITGEAQNENPETSEVDHQQDANRMEVKIPTLNETTLLANEKEAFALEPVAITPNLGRKGGKRKRILMVDQIKELTNESIRKQINDSSDLVVPMDMAPPTQWLMQWTEGGGARKLLAQPCSTVAALQLKEFFAESIFQVKYIGVCDEVEVMRQDEEGQRDISVLNTGNVSVVDSSIHPEQTHNTELMDLDHINDSQISSMLTQGENRSEFSHPELPSEDSMFVHPSFKEMETQSTSPHSQVQSVLDSQDFEERSHTRHAQKLLNSLKRKRYTKSSLEELCEGGTRSQAATTFFCFLFLKKQKVLLLHQSTPYGDIIATPGPKFYD